MCSNLQIGWILQYRTELLILTMVRTVHGYRPEVSGTLTSPSGGKSSTNKDASYHTNPERYP